jgi:hypothetical protein
MSLVARQPIQGPCVELIGDAFILWFRLYGPEEHLFNRSWMLPDIDRVARYCHALLLLAPLRQADRCCGCLFGREYRK